MTPPILPVELTEKILFSCWTTPLPIGERITLMTSAVSVNSIWRAIFLRVSSRDVHIPCPSFADQFLRILRQECPLVDKETRYMANRLCRSLTIQITNENIHKGVFAKRELPMEKALSSLLYRLHDPSTPVVPNLRRITIEYHDTGFDGVFDNWTLIAFPNQVTELQLSYSFSPGMPPWLRTTLRSKHERQAYTPPWTTPSVRTLTVLGASDALVSDMVMTCPNMENLVTDIALLSSSLNA
ncbi:hypothetical protein C8R44DRAFT_216881 [Mycena epipterygia]|nr:hypothetical protein C8R44DRAFT_216881 [Mycena epipterygia]